MSLSTQVQEKVEGQSVERRQARHHPSGERGFAIWLSALIGVGLVVAVVSVMLNSEGSAAVESGRGLEQAELDMITARLEPHGASVGTVWDLSPVEMGFITSRVGEEAAASVRIGAGDLDAAELEFITGRSHPTEQNTGHWSLEPAELEFISG